jgi:hypothetical protein
MDSDMLRHQVRERIRQGRLPGEEPRHTWAGAGAGFPCGACDRPISSGETEFELEFDGSSGPVIIRLHAWCHSMWIVEQRRA